MNNDSYKKYHGLDHQWTWRDMLGTIGVIFLILLAIALLSELLSHF